MAQSKEITSIILAGGKSSRLGHDKVFETINGQSLIQRVVQRLDQLSEKIIVVISRQLLAHAVKFPPEVETVVDIYPENGHLGGIYTGLATSETMFNIVVGTDMPFLNLDLLRYLVHILSAYDVAIPKLAGQLEPVHAAYSKNCVPYIEKVLLQGKRRAIDFFSSVRVRYVTDDEIDRFDPGHLSFFNINTQADLERARGLADQAEKVSGKGLFTYDHR